MQLVAGKFHCTFVAKHDLQSSSLLKLGDIQIHFFLGPIASILARLRSTSLRAPRRGALYTRWDVSLAKPRSRPPRVQSSIRSRRCPAPRASSAGGSSRRSNRSPLMGPRELGPDQNPVGKSNSLRHYSRMPHWPHFWAFAVLPDARVCRQRDLADGTRIHPPPEADSEDQAGNGWRGECEVDGRSLCPETLPAPTNRPRRRWWIGPDAGSAGGRPKRLVLGGGTREGEFAVFSRCNWSPRMTEASLAQRRLAATEKFGLSRRPEAIASRDGAKRPPPKRRIRLGRVLPEA